MKKTTKRLISYVVAWIMLFSVCSFNVAVTAEGESNIIKEFHNTEVMDGVTYSSEKSYAGSRSVCINYTIDGGDYYRFSGKCLDFGMEKDKTYNISFYINGDIQGFYVINAQKYCIWGNADYYSGNGNTLSTADANGWRKYEINNYTLDDVNRTLLFIQNNGSKGNNFYLDSLSIVDVATSKELVENGSFEPIEITPTATPTTEPTATPTLPVRDDNTIKELYNTSVIEGVAYSAAEAYEGDWSVHINATAGNYYKLSANCADFGMTTNNKYDISFYFKGDIKTVYITAWSLCVTDNKPYISGTSYPNVGQKVTGPDENGWYKFEVQDYTLKDDSQALLFMQDYKGENNFYMDKLSVIDKSANKELVENGSFEPIEIIPTEEPTSEPTATPTEEPTSEPTATPTEEPTLEPTATPTEEPTSEPTATPTEEPTSEPTATPTEPPVRTDNIVKELHNVAVIDGVEYSAKEAYAGDWSVHVNKNADVSAVPSKFGITEGKTYNVSFYIKGNIGNLFVSLSGKNRVLVTNDDIRSGTLTDIKKIPLENGWTKVEINNAVVEKADWEPAFLVAEYNPDFYIDKLSITESDTELVENGSFEPAGESPTPTPTTPTTPTPTPEPSEPITRTDNIIREFRNTSEMKGITYSTDKAYSGIRSVYINHTVDGTDYYRFTKKCGDFGMEKGKTYNISFYINGDVQGFYIINAQKYCIWGNKDYYPGNGNTMSTADANGWRKYEIKDYTLDDETRTLLFIQNNDVKGNKFYLDNLSIVDVQTGNELIENGGFEPPAMEFGDYKITDNADGGKTVSIKVINHSAGENATAQLIVASYNGTYMTACSKDVEPSTIPENNQWVTLTQTISVKDGDKIVAYLWDSVDNMKSLVPAATIVE